MSKTAKIVIWVVVIVIVLVGGYYLLKNQGSNSTGPIKIGWIGPLTGDAANIGLNSQAATNLAVDEVNKEGGVSGRQIQVIYEDGQCAGAAANLAANTLINIDKVPVILGGFCSGETMAFSSMAVKAGEVVLSPCSSNPAITGTGIFRDYPSDSYQGNYAANYIYNTLGKKKVAVLYVQGDYEQGIKNVFDASFTKLGGTIIDEESVIPGSTDLRSQLTKIKVAKPDLIYFLGYTQDSTVGIQQARELGINTPFFGGDAWGDTKLWLGLGSAGEGSMYTTVYTPLTDAFTSAMKAKTSGDITTCSAEAYDGIKILAQVMNKVGTDPTAIRAALYKEVYTSGVSAPSIAFDSNGDLIGASYSVNLVHNGVASPVK
jgi:branched-chain amino acid transport system substrate-binding protein